MNTDTGVFCSNFDSLQSGWIGIPSDGVRPRVVGVENPDIYVYAVDASTGSTIAASANVADIELLHAETIRAARADSAHHAGLVHAASQSVLDYGAASPDRKERGVMVAVALCTLAVMLSTAYGAARSGSVGPDGHWVFIVDRTQDGSATGRTVYAGSRQGGFLDTDVLQTVVHQAVRQGQRASAHAPRRWRRWLS